MAECGGTDGASPASPEAGDDAPGEPAADASVDPCVVAQNYTFQMIASFGPDSFAPNGRELAGQYAVYVSYDETGTLYGPLVGPNSSAADPGNCPGAACPSVATEAPVPTNPGPMINDAGLTTDDAGIAPCETGFNAIGEQLPTPRCGTDDYALHLRATDLSSWGMNVGIDLRQNCSGQATDAGATGTNGPCYFDARGWTGVAVWAYAGPGSTGSTALVSIGDPETSSQLGGTYPYNDLLCGSPPCIALEEPTTGPAPLQCDPFSTAIGLSDHWQLYLLPFSEMRQKGFGLPESAPDLAHVLNFKFGLSNGQLGAVSWDVWIDNVAFYK